MRPEDSSGLDTGCSSNIINFIKNWSWLTWRERIVGKLGDWEMRETAAVNGQSLT